MIEIFNDVSFLNSRNIFDEPFCVFYCCELVIFTHIENNRHTFYILDGYFWDAMRLVFEEIGVLPPPILSVKIILLESCMIQDLPKMNYLPSGSTIQFQLVFHGNNGLIPPLSIVEIKEFPTVAHLLIF